MSKQELLLKEINQIPESITEELLDFIRFLKMKEASSFFYNKIDIDALAESQKVKPITDLEELGGDFWPEEENLDEFLTTIRTWRESGSRSTF